MSIPRRAFGTTGYSISTVGFGAWAAGGADRAYSYGRQDDTDSIAAIHRAVGARDASQVDGWIPGTSLVLDDAELERIATSILGPGAGAGPVRPAWRPFGA